MDLSFEAESPLAPPAELLERLPSCDCLLQGDRCCRSWNPGCQIFFPPSEAPGRPREQRCWSSFLEHRVPVVTEEVAREALLSFVDSKCCYGSAAAGDLVILELKQQVLRRYRLETFSESRISEWTFQPFTNHSVDGPQRGTSPRLWDIKVQVPPMFQEDTRKFQVPHSSLVKECHKCHGHGRYKCSSCHGAGTVRCPSCSRAKRRARPARRCQMCSGSGRQRCSTCSGRGNKTCATCKGEKKLLHFLQLVIVWKNSLFEFVSEHQLACPGDLLAKARGETLFKDENTMVYPIVDFPLREISLASQRGIAEHSAALASRARVLQQMNKRRPRERKWEVTQTASWEVRALTLSPPPPATVSLPLPPLPPAPPSVGSPLLNILSRPVPHFPQGPQDHHLPQEDLGSFPKEGIFLQVGGSDPGPSTPPPSGVGVPTSESGTGEQLVHKNLGFGHRAWPTVRPEKALLGLRSHFALWVAPVVFRNKSVPKPMTWCLSRSQCQLRGGRASRSLPRDSGRLLSKCSEKGLENKGFRTPLHGGSECPGLSSRQGCQGGGLSLK
ncbi:protein SSUH2 homolog isoform X3 [Delphinus delphis]|nr:protein SSUH2 homolog isoform X3 [Delphinus delphis]XP_059878940.1 protein SSUH2 homolog isoform X3 [Delphinus delphis]